MSETVANISKGLVNGSVTLLVELKSGAYNWTGDRAQTKAFGPPGPVTDKVVDDWIASLASNAGLEVTDFVVEDVSFGTTLGYVSMTDEELEAQLGESNVAKTESTENDSGTDQSDNEESPQGTREEDGNPSPRVGSDESGQDGTKRGVARITEGPLFYDGRLEAVVAGWDQDNTAEFQLRIGRSVEASQVIEPGSDPVTLSGEINEGGKFKIQSREIIAGEANDWLVLAEGRAPESIECPAEGTDEEE